MAITKLQRIGAWGVTREQLARIPRSVGRPRIIVGLLTGDAVVGPTEAPVTDREDGSPGKTGR